MHGCFFPTILQSNDDEARFSRIELGVAEGNGIFVKAVSMILAQLLYTAPLGGKRFPGVSCEEAQVRAIAEEGGCYLGRMLTEGDACYRECSFRGVGGAVGSCWATEGGLSTCADL